MAHRQIVHAGPFAFHACCGAPVPGEREHLGDCTGGGVSDGYVESVRVRVKKTKTKERDKR